MEKNKSADKPSQFFQHWHFVTLFFINISNSDFFKLNCAEYHAY